MVRETPEDSGRAKRFSEGRLAAAPSDLFQEVITAPGARSLAEPERFAAELNVDLAHTVMLAEQGIIARGDAAAICGALRSALAEGPDAIDIDTALDSTLFQVEAYLAREVGEETAGRMHTGRSRTDRGAAVMRYRLRNQLRSVVRALTGWQEALLKKGEEHGDTVLPGYTHMQAAQPITFGHHLLAQFWLHIDDLDRLRLAYEHTNVNPLGTASIAGTSWPLDRARTQELLGFDASTENARVSRTYIFRAEVANAYATVMATLHYLASDFYIWYAHEFRLVEPADELSGSSSIMPQKKNPYVWERTRVMARHASGWGSSALAALMGASSSDSFLEPPEIERYGPIVAGLIRVNAEVLKSLRVDKARMLELAREQFSTANHLADVLVRERGLDFRQAHAAVGRLVRLCGEEGTRPDAVTRALLDRAAREVGVDAPALETDAIREALDPAAFVETRATMGSTNPKDVLRQIGEGRPALQHYWRWLRAADDRVADSEAKLRGAVSNLVDG